MTATFDHDLKIERAFHHLDNLKGEEARWLNGDHHSIRTETDANTGVTTFLCTAEQPPVNPFSLLIGDCLHNLRSALDNLAFALARAYSTPLPNYLAQVSEFPIFGDQSKGERSGVGPTLFRDNGLQKVRGWDPKAQAILETFQPYKRGSAYRSHPLWLLHDLDRVNKHRVLHTVVASFSGTFWDTRRTVNVGAIEAGVIESLRGMVSTDTPIARVPRLVPMDPSKDMHMEIQPALRIAFAEGTPSAEKEPVLQTLFDIYTYVGGDVLDTLRRFL